ncbi:hypothetical protein CC80DRAFT_561046, partial [Byssothecium circinans]
QIFCSSHFTVPLGHQNPLSASSGIHDLSGERAGLNILAFDATSTEFDAPSTEFDRPSSKFEDHLSDTHPEEMDPAARKRKSESAPSENDPHASEPATKKCRIDTETLKPHVEAAEVADSRLMSLPKELRDEVYSHLNTVDDVIIVPRSPGFLYERLSSFNALFLTSRFNYDDAHSFLDYKHSQQPVTLIYKPGPLNALEIGRTYDLLYLAKLGPEQSPKRELDIYTRKLAFGSFINSVKFGYRREDDDRANQLQERKEPWNESWNVKVRIVIDEIGYQSLKREKFWYPGFYTKAWDDMVGGVDLPTTYSVVYASKDIEDRVAEDLEEYLRAKAAKRR